MAYIDDNGLGGWGGWSRIANVVRKSVGVALAPSRAVFNVARKSVRVARKSVRRVARKSVRVARKSVRVALAPSRAVFHGGRAAFRGQSIGKAVNEQMQPVKQVVMQAAPLISFIPVYGTAIAAVIALEKLRQQRAAARDDQRQSDAIDAEIAQTNAQIIELQKKEALARGPLTANATAGRVSAANNPEGVDSGITANNPEGVDSGITANKIVAVDKKIPWGLVTAIGAITIAALKK